MKRKWMIIIAAFLTIVLLGTTLFFLTAKRNQVTNRDEVETQEPVKKEKELILGFDSYEEITKTALKLTSLFGKTGVNTDETYIKQGEGSWMVCPAGDPHRNILPQFRMRCIETSFKTNNFEDFEKVTMDIYNASDIDTTIQWYFTAMEGTDVYVETNPIIYTLKANSWTTCEYSLVDEEYSSYFYLNMVKYMTVDFFDKNQDITLYFDNLEGHYLDAERVRADMSCDFWEGVGMEKSTDKYFLNTVPGGGVSSMLMSRVAYDDIEIEKLDDSFGDYCIKADVTNKLWPSVMPDYGEVIPAGSVLSFMVYVEADESISADMTYRIESVKSLEEGTRNTVLQTNFKFNQWNQVDIVLAEDSTTTRAFINLDDNYGNYKLGETRSNVYMDNFIITEKKEEVAIGEDGSITLKNPYNRKEIQYIVEKPVKEGEIISFDIDFNKNEPIAVWVLGDDTWLDEWYAYGHEEWTGEKFVQTTAQSDSEFFYIMVQFRAESGEYEDNEVTIRNIKVSNEIELHGNANTNYTTYTFKKPISAGNHITFDIDVQPAQSVSIWVMGDGMWEQEYFAKAYETWDGKQTITADIRESTEKLTFHIQFNDESFDWSKAVVKVGTIKVSKGYLNKVNKVTVDKQGTVKVKNLSGGKRVAYMFDQKVKAGQNVSFKVDVTPAQRMAVWIMDQNYKEYYAYDYEVWTGERVISVDIPEDMEKVYVLVEFRDETKDYSKNVVTITKPEVGLSNLEVKKDGTVIMRNKLNANYRSYRYELPVEAYRNITFDLEITSAKNVSVWVMGDNMWEAEYFAYNFANWTGKETISADVWEDTKTITIYVQFNDKDTDLTKNVITISKPVLKAANVEEKEDGTVILRNSTGAKRLNYIFEKEVKAGQIVSIDVDVEKDQNMALWIMNTNFVEYGAVGRDPWSGTYTVTATIPEDVSKVRILIEFRDETIDLTQNVVTISNFEVKEPQIVENEDGSVFLRNDANNTILKYTWTENVSAGSEFKFDVETTYDKYVAVFVISPSAGNTEYFACEYAPGTPISIKGTATKDESALWIWIQFRSSSGVVDQTGDKTGVETYIKNLTVTKPQIVENEDGSVLLKNDANNTTLKYTWTENVSAGSEFKFDVETTYDKYVAVFVISPSAGNTEYFAQEYAPGTPISIQGIATKEESALWIWIQFRSASGVNDQTSDKTGVETYVKNKIITSLEETVIEIKNPENKSQLGHVINQPAQAGSTISFDVECNTEYPVALWILGDGSWAKEWYANGYVNQNGKLRVTSTLRSDVSSITIWIQYRDNNYQPDTTSDKTGRVVTITNLNIDVSVGESVIEITNPENLSQLGHVINQAVSAGSTITFDVECNTEYPVALWILGDGSWEKEWYANGFINRNGKLTVSSTIRSDVSSVTIWIQYRNNDYQQDNTSDKTDRVIKITNLEIE